MGNGKEEGEEKSRRQEEREYGRGKGNVCSGILWSILVLMVLFVCFLGNRPHPSATEPPFPDSDPRRQFALKSCDPRIHFALVCGAVVSGYDPVFLRSSCKLPRLP